MNNLDHIYIDSDGQCYEAAIQLYKEALRKFEMVEADQKLKKINVTKAAQRCSTAVSKKTQLDQELLEASIKNKLLVLQTDKEWAYRIAVAHAKTNKTLEKIRANKVLALKKLARI